MIEPQLDDVEAGGGRHRGFSGIGDADEELGHRRRPPAAATVGEGMDRRGMGRAS